MTTAGVYAILVIMAVAVALAVWAGPLGAWMMRIADRIDERRTKAWLDRPAKKAAAPSEGVPVPATVEARLAQAEARIAELTAQVEDLRVVGRGHAEAQGVQRKVADSVQPFPLVGVLTWCAPLLVALALTAVVGETAAMWLLFVFFALIYGVGGVALFFSSDYAQKRWNPEGL